jgi:hypothetical protein
MTSGRGIAHAEQSPPVHPALLHGVQLWVALPSSSRDVAPAWAHHADLPRYSDAGLSTTVIMGSVAGATSPGQAYSPIVGADVALAAGADALLPLEPDFEHAVLVTSGSVDVDGLPLAPGSMLYLGVARRDLRLHSTDGARALLLGGEPFAEQIVMWWNFVARSSEEITSAREQWMSGSRFGTVVGGGDPLVAPPVPPGRLKPGGAVR